MLFVGQAERHPFNFSLTTKYLLLVKCSVSAGFFRLFLVPKLRSLRAADSRSDSERRIRETAIYHSCGSWKEHIFAVVLWTPLCYIIVSKSIYASCCYLPMHFISINFISKSVEAPLILILSEFSLHIKVHIFKSIGKFEISLKINAYFRSDYCDVNWCEVFSERVDEQSDKKRVSFFNRYLTSCSAAT